MKAIKLDLDGGKSLLRETLKRIEIANKILDNNFETTIVYKTKHGWHLYITAKKDLGEYRIVAMQAILGSDWARELYNYKRVGLNKSKNWNILFKVKRNLEGKILSKEKYYCTINYKRVLKNG